MGEARGNRAGHRSEGGQAIAEFAIVFPVLLVLVLGIIQGSLMFTAKMVVEYAAYAAARAELVGEEPERAAELVCSAIAGPSYTPGTGKPITVPGWGVLPRSESSSIKTHVDVLDPIEDGNGTVTVEVTHYYELIIPAARLVFAPGTFVTLNDAPHLVLKSRHTRPVPWDKELEGVTGHPPIPPL